MLTVKQLDDIRYELEHALQFMNDIKEQFVGHEEEQFGDSDIESEIRGKKEMIALIKGTIAEMQKEENAMWDMLVECLDTCGDSGEAHFIKDKMKDVEVNDYKSLKDSLDENELNFLNNELTDLLIEKDLECDREEAMKVSFLLGQF